MTKEKVKDIYRNKEMFTGHEIIVSGWIRTIRDSKTLGFIELNDGSFFKSIQVVFEESELENYKDVARQGVGGALEVTGTLVLTPDAKQPFEMKAKMISILGTCPPEYPLQKKRHSFEFLRTIAHLRPRSNTFSAVFRVRSTVAFAIHKFFNERGYVYVHTPIITGSDCEGAGEMFRVTTLSPVKPDVTEDNSVDFTKDFFGKETNLTVSGQLAAEAFSMAFGNIYTFGPTFRAEKSNTARHAAEFWMIEPEMAFADLADDMDIMEEMIKYIINYTMENAPEEIEFFNSFIDTDLKSRLENLISSEFAKVTYTEAVEILKNAQANFEFPIYWGCDLQTEHEKYLTEKHFKKPVFVTDYPKDIKAFYMRMNDDNRTVAACDLLVPGIGEIIGGSQREERYDRLIARIAEMGLDAESYWWYLELRKYGGVRHAGFGLGFERLLMYITGIANIRDVIPFPRTTGNAEF